MDTSRLTVELANFRCHTSYSVTIEPNKIYHLVGDSGNGKTTILEAIYWCLYGGKGAKVAPLKATSKTSTFVKVTLITSKMNIVLTRKTNAHVFNVVYKTECEAYRELEGETAQVYVEELFGSSSLWMSTSYLRQKSFHPFLQGSAEDKRKILNRLAFRHDTTEHIDKIMDETDTLVHAATIKRETLYKQFNAGLERYTLAHAESGVDLTDLEANAHTQIPDVQAKLNLVKENRTKLNAIIQKSMEDHMECKRLETVVNGMTLNDVTRKQKQLEVELENIGVQEKRKAIELEMVQKHNELKGFIETNRRALDIIHATNRTIEGVKQEIAALVYPSPPVYLPLPSHPDPDTLVPTLPFDLTTPTYTQKDVQNAMLIEQRAMCSSHIAKEFGLPNTQHAISQEIARLTAQLVNVKVEMKKAEANCIAKQTKERLRSYLSDLQTRTTPAADALPKLNTTLHELRLREHTERQRIIELQKAMKVRPLECPHCKGYVIITQQQTLAPIGAFDPEACRRELNELQKSDVSLQIEAVERSIADETRRQMEQRRLTEEIARVTKEMEGIIIYPDVTMDSKEEEILQTAIQRLKGWEYVVTPNISSETMAKSMELYTQVENRKHQVEAIRQQQRAQTASIGSENEHRKMAYERALAWYDRDKATLEASLSAKLLILEKGMEEVESRKSKALAVQEQFEALEKELSRIPNPVVNKTREMVWKEQHVLDNTAVNIKRLEELRQSPRIQMYEKRVQKQVEVQGSIDKLNQRLVYLEKCKGLAAQRDALVLLRDEFELAQFRETKAIELRDGMIRIQHSRFAMSTTRINMLLSTIVGEMYTKPISVHLKMFKTAKTTKRTKPNVNLCVTMDNEEIDVGVISGGESDRLSIALTLALSKVRESPILLLDECFASLPANDRERTITSIVYHGKANDRFFFCIAPNSSSGWFEKEIPIG